MKESDPADRDERRRLWGRRLLAGWAVLLIIFLGGSVCRVEITETRNDHVTRNETHFNLIWFDNSLEEPPWSTPPSNTFPIHFNKLRVRRTYAFGLVDVERTFMDIFSPSFSRPR
jgi:hypothetical protein